MGALDILVILGAVGMAVANPTLTSNIDKIETGVTQSLDLACTAISNTSDLKLITSLAVFFTQENSMQREQVTTFLPMLPNPNTSANYTGMVIANKNGTTTTLNIAINTPADKDAGLYECEARGFDDLFNPVAYIVNTTVAVNMASPAVLEDTIKQMAEEVKTMKNRWQQVDLSSIFHRINDPTNNRRYLLSRSEEEHINLCQFMCAVQGGYLAEINDEAEFDFVKKFTHETLKDIQDADVFIGATDKESKGNWQFFQNTKATPYIEMGGFASQGYDCLILSHALDYLMNDYDCNQPARFLCEVPL